MASKGAARRMDVEARWALRVASGGVRTDYPVIVERGLLASLGRLVRRYAPGHGYAVIADETVAGLYGDGVLEDLAAGGGRVRLMTFPAGEREKTRASWARLTDALLQGGFGRDSVVVALGGGVTGDLAGFVAATFLRGVPVVQVPTSLVAMIDASVGGKTAVDTPAGKNLVGAFHAPSLVAVDPDVVRTLPRTERSQGLAEAAKHGAILDAGYLGFLEENASALLDGDPAATEEAVRRSVEIKADVVSRDEREGGLREILNFGHTLGHALEAASEYRIPHGSAVSVGMVLEARLGEALGVTETGTAARLGGVLSMLELPTRVPDGTASAPMLAFTRTDKKRRADRSRYVLLRRPGEVAVDSAGAAGGWTRPVTDEAVEGVLEAPAPASGRELET